MRKLSGALGFALLATSLVFGSSVVYAQVTETEASTLAAAFDSHGNGEKAIRICGTDRSDAVTVCKTDAEPDALPTTAAAEVDHAPSATGDVDPLPNEAAAPGIVPDDAIVVDIVETVTVAVPGEKSADEEPASTGSLPFKELIIPPDSSVEEPSVGDATAPAYDDLE